MSRCGDDVEVLCGCVFGKLGRGGRDAGGKVRLGYSVDRFFEHFKGGRGL